MMRNFLFTLLISAAAAISCSSDGRLKDEQRKKLQSLVAGNWISNEYLDSLFYYGSPAKARNARCFELVVSAQLDSVAWLTVGHDLKIYSIRLLNDTAFRIENLQYLVYYSSVYRTLFVRTDKDEVKLKKLDRKYAVKSINGWLSGIILYLNEEMIADEYLLVDEITGETTPCFFSSYGQMGGISTYRNFSLCYAGSCLNQSDEDLIILSDEKSSDRYIWKWKVDTLGLYSIINTGSLSQPQFTSHEIMFRLIKKR